MTLAARLASLARRDALTGLGLALSGVWLLLVLLFWLLGPPAEAQRGGVTRLVSAFGVVLPLVLVWMGVAMARALALLRAEAAELRRQLDAMRPDLPGAPAPEPQAEPQPEAQPEPASAQPRPRPRPTGDQRQAAMRFEAPPSQPVDAGTLIRALNFPDGPDDHDAIEALRAALRDQDNSRVLRAAQDVVTLLAGRDIYMDMLPPAPAPAAVWRRFAEGQRGSAVAALGGIDDPDALQTTAAMLRDDEVFRDAAHHFLRHFDGLLARLVPELDDLQIAVLGDSRSGRAFMLLGRATGSFG
ncbi:hypothetical protein [Paracoccus sp. (in: a-proteobacteria)]|uniref:hypothetical protein n=1 Tax=Paracoccus sp. TaxID=267 RepID=UPI00272B658F|nr:hypothetical protein [Paracoccus sp. (in: a-proteobacteria)]